MKKEDFRKAYEDSQQKGAFFIWVSQRKETLKSSVSAHDVLRHFGSELKFNGEREEQICCPFHGDKDPSARIYTAQGDSPSGVYCWVCRKRWDIFGLWKEFHGDSEMRFTAVLLGLEKAFGIITPEAPDMSRDYGPRGPTEEEQAVLDRLEVCERRLKLAKPNFQLKGFLIIGKLLDNLHYQVKHGLIDVELADKNVQLILNKIGEKTRGG
jgi:hypothetical protein